MVGEAGAGEAMGFGDGRGGSGGAATGLGGGGAVRGGAAGDAPSSEAPQNRQKAAAVSDIPWHRGHARCGGAADTGGGAARSTTRSGWMAGATGGGTAGGGSGWGIGWGASEPGGCDRGGSTSVRERSIGPAGWRGPSPATGGCAGADGGASGCPHVTQKRRPVWLELPHRVQATSARATGGGAGEEGCTRGVKRISGAGGRCGTAVGPGGTDGADASTADVSGRARDMPMGGVGDAILAFSLWPQS